MLGLRMSRFGQSARVSTAEDNSAPGPKYEWLFGDVDELVAEVNLKRLKTYFWVAFECVDSVHISRGNI